MTHLPLKFQAQVTRLSQQGFGIVKGPDARNYFVRGAWRGDVIAVESTSETSENIQFAEIIQIIQASEERQAAACPHFGTMEQQCYGCPWLIATYPAQLAEKQHRVVYALERVGFNNIPIQNIWAAPSRFHYRQRAQFKTDGVVLGYAGRQGLAIAPIDRCLVLTDRMSQHLEQLQAHLPNKDWQPDAAHRWTYLDIDEASHPATIIPNRRQPFQQANQQQNLRMQQWLIEELASTQRQLPLLELFAGSGNFTRILVEMGFSQIFASEVGESAIQKLLAHKWPGVQVKRLDLYRPEAIRTILQYAAKTKILLLNPPRAGLMQLNRLIRLLTELQSILYIACDPSSFASDAKRIVNLGFKLTLLQPLDQMPQTPHVEILARFERA